MKDKIVLVVVMMFSLLLCTKVVTDFMVPDTIPTPVNSTE